MLRENNSSSWGNITNIDDQTAQLSNSAANRLIGEVVLALSHLRHY